MVLGHERKIDILKECIFELKSNTRRLKVFSYDEVAIYCILSKSSIGRFLC